MSTDKIEKTINFYSMGMRVSIISSLAFSAGALFSDHAEKWIPMSIFSSIIGMVCIFEIVMHCDELMERNEKIE